MKKISSLFLSVVMLLSITAGIDSLVYAATNTTPETAKNISLNKKYYGNFSYMFETHYYKFTLPSSGRLDVKVKNGGFFAIGNDSYSQSLNNSYNRDFGYRKGNTTLFLNKGTYYLCADVQDYPRGKYEFTLNFKSTKESFSEPCGGNNNYIGKANPIYFYSLYNGQITKDDNVDFYSFTMPSKGVFQFYAEYYKDLGLEAYIADKHGNFMNVNDYEGYTDTVNKDYRSYGFNITLPKGDYYLRISGWGYGDYNFGTSTTIPYYMELSRYSYTYDGKTKKPSVKVTNVYTGKRLSSDKYTVTYPSGRKSVGKYTVTVKFRNGHKGTYKKTFTIKPKSTSILSLKKGSKKFTLKWKKQTSQTSGYQVQYATNSKFKSAKTVTVSGNKNTSKTIKKLKGKKKYYVRVRTYKTVKGQKIYSSWSKAKSVSTKN